MTLRLLSILFILALLSTAFGNEPNSAIDWFIEPANENEIFVEGKPDKIKRQDVIIEKSNLRPNNLNNIGIISTKITGIDPSIWEGVDENILFTRLTSLSHLNFHSAQTFLKRILISETNPPISSITSNKNGKLYLLAKLDKLIEMGALDEAETTILQVPKIEHDLFLRWIKISFLTGRLTKLCETLRKNPGLNQNLSVRIVCLRNQNDWDAAALTLSAASSLNLLSQNRETLLVHYLDPTLIASTELTEKHEQMNEIDYFILNSADKVTPLTSDKVKYNYLTFKKSSNINYKIQAAEELAIKKAINVSSLFDLYRNNHIGGANGVWRRMIAVKNLDMALRRNNAKQVGIALTRAVDTMSEGNLLFALALEYADKLEKFTYEEDWNGINDYYAIIFALNEEIPRNWNSYRTNNQYLTMAFNILNQKDLNASIIGNAIKLVNPDFETPLIGQKTGYLAHLENSTRSTTKSETILQALHKSSHGVNTAANELYSSLLLLLQVEEEALAQSILIEYLIYFSRRLT